MTGTQGAGWMNATAAMYQTKITAVTPTLNAWFQVADANPKRWWIEFIPITGGGANTVPLPGRPGLAIQPPTNFSVPLTFKWLDAPGVVTGSWWVFQTAGASLYVVECIYIGP